MRERQKLVTNYIADEVSEIGPGKQMGLMGPYADGATSD